MLGLILLIIGIVMLIKTDKKGEKASALTIAIFSIGALIVLKNIILLLCI